MIQTNLQTDKISGYFGIAEERKIELDAEFKRVRNEQNPIVLNEILNTAEKDILHIGYHRVPVINAFMAIAKNENEQLYCAFMAAQEIEQFTRMMNTAVKGAFKDAFK